MKINFLPYLVAGVLLFAGGATRPVPVHAQAGAMPDYVLPAEPVPAKETYAKEINAFWEADKKQPPPKNAVLFMGSSSVRIWKTLARDFGEIPVINRGFGGSQIFQSTHYLDRIALPYAPKIIVLFAGTNDLASGKTPQKVLTDYKEFVAAVHAKLPGTRIVFISISPTVARWKNEANVLETNYLIEKFTFQNNTPTQKLTYLSTHNSLLTPDGLPPASLLKEDGLHLNEDGYRVLVGLVKPRIMALAKTDGVQINTP